MIKNTKKVEEKPVDVKKVKRNMRGLLILALVVMIVALLYLGKSLFIVAMVNNQPISRLAVIRELESQSGKKALESIVTKTIILQEAKKQNIVILDGVIDDEIKAIDKNLKAQGQKLDDALAMQGLTKAQLRDQIRLQKILEKMLASDITVTEKEIDAFVKENKASIPKDSDMKKIRVQVKDKLKQDKLSAKIQKWVADHQKSSKILYFKTY